MTRKISVFGVVLLALWAVLCVPAFFVAGNDGVWGCSIAAAVCAVPALGTLAFSLWAAGQDNNWQLTALLGGMLGRMGFALGAGIVIHRNFQGYTLRSFLIWLVIYYLASLMFEVGIVMRGISQNKSSHGS